MNFLLFIIPIILATTLSCSSDNEQQQLSEMKMTDDMPSILVFSKTAGFRHESIEAGIAALKKIGENHNLQFTFTENSDLLASESIFDFDAVVFLNTTGTLFDEKDRVFLQRFIQSGGGFVGIHSAADTEYDWPWYEGLVGAYFKNHPNNPNVRRAIVKVLNEEHPAVQDIPGEWERRDEWYNYRSFQDGLNILMKMDTESYEGSEHPGNHPIAWYREYDGGRTFYTGMGHTSDSFSEPLFLKHLTGGIFYAIDKELTNP